MILGKDLIVSINGTAVAASKGCSLKMQQNYIKSCSPTDGRTKRKIPTDYDWSVSTDCLIADTAYADSIIDLLTAGTEVTLRWYDTELHQKRKGQAIIASIDENAPVNSLSTLSITLEGSGQLGKFDSSDYPFYLDGTLFTQAAAPDANGVFPIGGTVDANGVWSK